MSKKKKLEEGLNRLFSSPAQVKTNEPVPQDKLDSANTVIPKEELIKVEQTPLTEISKPPVEQPISIQSPDPAPRLSENAPVEQARVEESAQKAVNSQPEMKLQERQAGLQGSSQAQSEAEPSQPLYSHFKDEQVVVFSLSGQLFGLNIANVESIISMQPITELPRAPEYMKGVTNLRGRVVPVFSLSQRLGLPENVNTKNSRIIIVNISGYDAGMVVDEVKSVSEVPARNMSLPSDIISVDSSCVRAIATIDERLVILLELEEIFSFQSVQ